MLLQFKTRMNLLMKMEIIMILHLKRMRSKYLMTIKNRVRKRRTGQTKKLINKQTNLCQMFLAALLSLRKR